MGERAIRTFDLPDAPIAELVEAKRDAVVSVCLPARDEAATVGEICSAIRRDLMDGPGGVFVDELLVLDDGSRDATAAAASSAGAQVIAVADVLAEHSRGHGKGNVLWKSVAAAKGDIVVWCDADLTSFTSRFVTRLVAPLLNAPEVAMVKAFYDRPTDGAGAGGGRTTELVARPLFSMFFPELAALHQPLGGECAARRAVLERVPFVQGYGVEVGLLIDIARLLGVDAIAQVDLGVRRHRHRTLRELSVQAAEVMHAVLRRAGVEGLGDACPHPILRPGAAPDPVNVAERPPLFTLP